MNKINTLGSMVALCWASMAQAQTVSVKWGSTSKTVWVHTAMPSGCDEAIVRGVAAWNALPVNFKYAFDKATNLTTTRWSTGSTTLVIEDGATSSSTALASTSRSPSSPMTIAHIVVKADYLWYNGTTDQSGGKFYCPATAGTTPSSQYDFQTTITHELGMPSVSIMEVPRVV